MQICSKCTCSKAPKEFGQNGDRRRSSCLDCESQRQNRRNQARAGIPEGFEKKCQMCMGCHPAVCFRLRKKSEDGLAPTCRRCVKLSKRYMAAICAVICKRSPWVDLLTPKPFPRTA